MTLSDHGRPQPLVSVIIPCFNQGRFLADAIDSVRKQTYPNLEILVVDDGSTDETRDVANTTCVRYTYQSNAGLSAARNRGIAESNGLFLVFLDADDVLFPEAVAINLNLLLRYPSWAFVSGGHEKVDECCCPLRDQDEAVPVSEDHYIALLRGNYIGMHAAVMYRRRVLDAFKFDTGLAACEDYDLYLRIARRYPIGSHTRKIAAYRHHGENMSGNWQLMLTQVLRVHGRQQSALRNTSEVLAWREGRANWKKYYAGKMHRQLSLSIRKDERWPSREALMTMASVMPGRFRNYVVKKIRHNLRMKVKRTLPDPALRVLHWLGIYKTYTPEPGKIRAGDFHRLTPFSVEFGFDRGGALDRFYIEQFLEQHRHRIRGHVLEIGDNTYTMRFGGAQVRRSDVLHIDNRNKQATYVGDIVNVPQIPSQAFDCIILTQTLHLIYDFKGALRTCHRILKPGGCLLLTVPGISRIDQGEWQDYWLWSFTGTSVKKLLDETFNGSSVDIETFGNVYVAAAFLYGVGLPEVRKDWLLKHDPGFQVIISAAAVKA